MRRSCAAAAVALGLALPARAAACRRSDAGARTWSRTRPPARCWHRRTRTRRSPIASITKLMTVLLALQHHRLTDVVDRRSARGGGGRVERSSSSPASGSPSRDLVKAALIQSANDAADALALSVAPSFPAFAVLMNDEGCKARAARHALRAPGRARRAGRALERRRRDEARAHLLMRNPFVRRTVAEETATIAGGQVLHTWDDLLSQRARRDRREDGPHGRRRAGARSPRCAAPVA